MPQYFTQTQNGEWLLLHYTYISPIINSICTGGNPLHKMLPSIKLLILTILKTFIIILGPSRRRDSLPPRNLSSYIHTMPSFLFMPLFNLGTPEVSLECLSLLQWLFFFDWEKNILNQCLYSCTFLKEIPNKLIPNELKILIHFTPLQLQKRVTFLNAR